jgi:hypothetical protein
MATKRKRELPRRKYEITLNGELTGYHVTMAAMRGREIIALMRDEMSEADALDLIVERCISHDFGVDDIRELDLWMLEAILEAWQKAMQEWALPPTTAEPSPKGSAA